MTRKNKKEKLKREMKESGDESQNVERLNEPVKEMGIKKIKLEGEENKNNTNIDIEIVH